MGKVARYLPKFRAGRIFSWALGIVPPMLSVYQPLSEQFRNDKVATVVHTEVSWRSG